MPTIVLPDEDGLTLGASSYTIISRSADIGAAVVLGGANVRLYNYAHILEDALGVGAIHNTGSFGGHDIFNQSTGVISGHHGIHLTSSGNAIVNRGQIDGLSGSGVLFDGAANSSFVRN